jgi:hypothetical protein
MTRAALKYSDDQPRDDNGRFASGGLSSSGRSGASGAGVMTAGSDQQTIARLATAYSESLSTDEKNALNQWGNSGKEIRQLQNGTYRDDESHVFTREQNEKFAADFQAALDKAPTYDGTVYRGLSDVPMSSVESWQDGDKIVFQNDQSSTASRAVADSFHGSGWGDKQDIVFIVDQSSGRALMDMTNVTYGGRSVSESEVVLRKGSAYTIEEKSYIDSSGRRWDSETIDRDKAEHIEYYGRDKYSMSNLPPEYSDPWKTYKGYWEIRLTEGK